jgi:Coenzyme PQQ synthesis protein D (PqqD)
MTLPMTDPFAQVYRKDPSIVARQIAGEMILVPIRQNVGDLESIYLLNQTALFAWNLFDGVLSLAQIRTRLTIEFDVDEDQAGRDLLELVADLQRLGALAPS